MNNSSFTGFLSMLLICSIILHFNSCKNLETIFDSNTTEKVQTTVDKINNITESIEKNSKEQSEISDSAQQNNNQIRENSKTIKDRANDIKSESNSSSINDNAEKIIDLSDENISLTDKNKYLLELNKRLALENSQYKQDLQSSNKELIEFAQDTEKLIVKIKELEDQKKTLLFAKLVWLVIIGVVVTAIGGALIFNSGTSGLGRFLGIVGLLVSAIALGITYYADHLALIAAITLVFIVGGIIYFIYSNRIKDKVIDESIAIINTAKREMNDNDEQRLFGKGKKSGYVTGFASKHTLKALENSQKAFYKG